MPALDEVMGVLVVPSWTWRSRHRRSFACFLSAWEFFCSGCGCLYRTRQGVANVGARWMRLGIIEDHVLSQVPRLWARKVPLWRGQQRGSRCPCHDNYATRALMFCWRTLAAMACRRDKGHRLPFTRPCQPDVAGWIRVSERGSFSGQGRCGCRPT